MIMSGVEDPPDRLSVNTQPGIRAFLAHYMEHLSSRAIEQATLTSESAIDDEDEDVDDGKLDEVRVCRRLINAFHAVPRPISCLALPRRHHHQPDNDDDCLEPEKQALVRDMKRLASDVDMLACDQRLQSVIRTVAGPSLRTLQKYTTHASNTISSNSDSSTITIATCKPLTASIWIFVKF